VLFRPHDRGSVAVYCTQYFRSIFVRLFSIFHMSAGFAFITFSLVPVFRRPSPFLHVQ